MAVSTNPNILTSSIEICFCKTNISLGYLNLWLLTKYDFKVLAGSSVTSVHQTHDRMLFAHSPGYKTNGLAGDLMICQTFWND